MKLNQKTLAIMLFLALMLGGLVYSRRHEKAEAQMQGLELTPVEDTEVVTAKKHTNRLIEETSPYLLQHAHNPVDWHAWSDKAFAQARAEDKPIFLSIGYSTCHWCHVMEHESFENEAIAAVMNEHFICIKVDREQRPDVDAIYMEAVQAMTGSGGWPLSAFLTPEGKPFYGGTYFPPGDRYGRPGFKKILLAVADAWTHKRDDLLDSAEKLKQILSQSVQPSDDELTKDVMANAASVLERSYDSSYGGFGRAPKFPQPSQLSLLLRYGHKTGSDVHLKMATETLMAMAHGGIYDHLGGGFHRYATDAKWLVPHFEKMLYDQALISQACVEAYKVGGDPELLRVLRETLDYVLRDMTDAQGGFYSAEDADSEGEEGTFYLWTPAQTKAVLGPQQAALFDAYYGVTEQGNFEHQTSILNVTDSLDEVAAQHKLAPDELRTALDAARTRLFQAREQRIRPHRDDKIIAAWNGLFISSLAKSGAVLSEERYLLAAQKAADFVLSEMVQGDRLHRSMAQGKLSGPGFLEDYAFFIAGLLDLYEATFEGKWLAEAETWAQRMVELFKDEGGGAFFMTAHDSEALLIRNKPDYDGAVPSGNSVAALVLLRLHHVNARELFLDQAEQIIRGLSAQMQEAPMALTYLMGALDFWLGPTAEITIVGNPENLLTRQMIEVIHASYLPNAVVLLRDMDAKEQVLDRIAPFTQAQVALNGQTTAYVCENRVCKRPTTTLDEFRRALAHDAKLTP
jgi:uncharacterized protein